MVLNIGKNGFLDYPISFGDGRPFGLMPKLREREREGVDASFRCNSLQSVRPNSKDAEVPKTGVPPNHPFIDGFPL